MSLRARIRRTHAERAKIDRMANTPEGNAMKQAMRGQEDGKKLAAAFSVMTLHRFHGFRKKRITDILELCSNEVERIDREGKEVAIKYYSEKVGDAMIRSGYKYKSTMADAYSVIYENNRDQMYLKMTTLIAMALSEYGWAPNKQGTGRIDRFLDAMAVGFMKYHEDGHDTEFYIKKCEDITGMRI